MIETPNIFWFLVLTLGVAAIKWIFATLSLAVGVGLGIRFGGHLCKD
jgi:hypothetical protein